MIVGVVIPTLRDRPEFLNFCLNRLMSQTKQPDVIALVDYPNTSGLVDISERYKLGLKYLFQRKVDLAIFIEDDDYYPNTYIEETCKLWEQAGKPDIFGCKETVYYHLPTRQYLTTSPNHSSAYCTAVTPKANIDVCGDNEAYYDIKLWKKNKGVQVSYKRKPIGIKHGIGRCGGSGHKPLASWYKLQDKDLTYLKSVVDYEAFNLYNKMFYNGEGHYDMFNIITRTHNREAMYKECLKSIISQSYKNVNHIVGSDIPCTYVKRYYKLQKQETSGVQPPRTYAASYNLYLNQLGKHVKEGWVMYLDDDDKFLHEKAIETIMNSIDNEEQLILWRVNINGKIVPSDKNFGKIVCGDISGIGFAFHTKHLPVDWGCWSLGDYRVINELSNKLEVKWINQVLTGTQGKPNRGKSVA